MKQNKLHEKGGYDLLLRSPEQWGDEPVEYHASAACTNDTKPNISNK